MIPRKKQTQNVLSIQESNASGAGIKHSSQPFTHKLRTIFIEMFKFHLDTELICKIGFTKNGFRGLEFSLKQTLNWCILLVEKVHSGNAAIAPFFADEASGRQVGDCFAKFLCSKPGKVKCHVSACVHFAFKTWRATHYRRQTLMITSKSGLQSFVGIIT